MKATLETPDQMLERLERMGVERVKSLLDGDHFDSKALGLVHGWIKRKAEQQNPTPPAPNFEEIAQEALKTARKAIREDRKTRAVVLKTQRLATIAIAVAGASVLISILTLFASALR
jgi:hypothetical protein